MITMPIKSDMSGLKTLADNARKLGETKQVLLLDLLNPAFISKHTKSPDFLSFCDSAGYKVETADDLKAIPDEPWDEFIAANSDFANWREMQEKAFSAWTAAKLMSGLKG
jgi:hypothetical protein